MIDFSQKTYAALRQAMLDRVPSDVDKRESSLVGTAVGPAAYALEEAYLDLHRLQQAAHLHSAGGRDLDLAAADIGLARLPATRAVRLGRFDQEVPLGARFSTPQAQSLCFTVTAREGPGRFRLTCETPGDAGNAYTGPLAAITFVSGLTSAQILDILIPGADEEEDEALRARCADRVNAKPFAGNTAAYREFVRGLDGVGGVQIYPVWNGGGTVKLSVVGADSLPASPALLAAVKAAVDPPEGSGLGWGMAPIGAMVTVATAEVAPIALSAAVSVAQGYTLDQVTPHLRAAASVYVDQVRAGWDTPVTPGTTQYAQVVYRARLIAALLMVEGVVNITGLRLNGVDADVQLVETGQRQQLPVLGEVVLQDGN